MKTRSARKGTATLIVCLCLVGSGVSAQPRDEVSSWRDVLYNSQDPENRSMAAVALLSVDDPQAEAVLRETLRDDERAAARVSILKAIRIRRDDRFLPLIIHLLDDPSEEVSSAAASALIAQRKDSARATIVHALQEPDYPPAIRCRLAGLAAAMRELKAVGPLIDLLSAAQEPLRRAALQALNQLTMHDFGYDRDAWRAWWEDRKDQGREALLEEIISRQQESVEKLKAQVSGLWLRVLELKKDAKDAGVLFEALATGLPEVQARSAELLGEQRPEGWVEQVAAQIATPDAGARTAFARALGKAEGEAARTALEKLLGDTNPKVAAAAARSLGGTKARKSLAKLLRLVGNGDPLSAVAAVWAIGEIGEQAAVTPLANVLGNPQAQRALREEAALALSKIKQDTEPGARPVPSPRAVQPLVEALKDPDERVRWSAAFALSRLGRPESVPALAEALRHDAAAEVRKVAALSLGKIGTPEAIEHLLAGMDDPNEGVSEQALSALLAATGPGPERLTQFTQELIQQNRNEKAARLARNAIAQYEKGGVKPEDIIGLRELLATALQNAGQWEPAREVCQALHAARPDEPAYRAKLLTCLVQLGEEQAALELAAEGVRKSPKKSADWIGPVMGILKNHARSENLEERRQVLSFVQAVPEKALAALPAALGTELAELKSNVKRSIEQPADKKLAEAVAGHIQSLAAGGDARRKAGAALTEIGRRAVPHLIEMGLKHNDQAVQGAVIGVLEKITGHSFELNEEMSAEKRQAAIQAWLQWWEKSRSSAGDSASAPGG